MRIAIVTETFVPSTDGVVTRLSHAVDYFMEKGNEVIVICPDVEGLPCEYKGAKLYGMASFVFPFYNQRPWAVPNIKVKEILEEFKPDIVHAVNPLSLAASGVHYAKRLKIPLICSFHTNVPNYLEHYGFGFFEDVIWNYLKDLHNSAPINLVTSNAMKELLSFHKVNGIRVLPIGVDLENRDRKFYSEEMRNRLTDGHLEDKLLIFVGRVAPEKEIESLHELMETRDDLRFAIIGDGPNFEELKELFKDTNTVFTGFLKGRELSESYASADAFIFPSTSETLGLVITESMASGTPVIAAYSEPTAEQIKNKENGLIYQKNSLDSLNECINLLDDREIYKKIQKNGRLYAESFSWENASQAMYEAYEDTIKIYEERG